MKVPLYDVVGGIAYLTLLVGIFVLVGVGRNVPEYFVNVLWVGTGVVFRSGVGVANDYLHRERAS